jgi:hypothetical protein
MMFSLSHGENLLALGPFVGDFDFVTWILSVCLERPVQLAHVTYFRVSISSFLGCRFPSSKYDLSRAKHGASALDQSRDWIDVSRSESWKSRLDVVKSFLVAARATMYDGQLPRCGRRLE